MLKQTLTSRIKLSLDLSDDLWPVDLDSNDLEDAVINMSINALHAMESGGQLTISTRNVPLESTDVQHLNISAGDYVLLSITDTGSGMDAVTREKVFDPFYSTKGELGTGLGLSQVYGFVERSGGTIKLYSELGHGSRFILYFPRSKKTIIKTQHRSSEIAQNFRGNETLLVVDDEQSMVELEYEILIAQGYQVLTANDGVQALAVLEKEKVNLIISDVIMPNMDGYQLAAQVRKLYPHIILQMVSGFSDERHIGMMDKLLHDNVLFKPFTSNLLLTRVRKLLDESHSTIGLSKRTILIMDDDVDIQNLLTINLHKFDCNVVTAFDGEEAVELYTHALETDHPIDIMIVDLNIPGGMGGIAVTKKIRKIQPNAKIIVASGDTEGPEMTNPQDYGFDASIEKSLGFDKIVLILEQVLMLDDRQ
jgi:CheY-like chemotaxis protein/TusA-related sulfurtransferase